MPVGTHVCAGAANVIFRHASPGVWVKEVRARVLYASTRVREYARKVCGPLVDKAGKIGSLAFSELMLGLQRAYVHEFCKNIIVYPGIIHDT